MVDAATAFSGFSVRDVPDERGVNRHGGPLIAWSTDPSGNVLSVLED